MDGALGFLTFGTLAFAVAFGYIGARTAQKQRNSSTPRSTLSADSPHWKATRRRTAASN